VSELTIETAASRVQPPPRRGPTRPESPLPQWVAQPDRRRSPAGDRLVCVGPGGEGTGRGESRWPRPGRSRTELELRGGVYLRWPDESPQSGSPPAAGPVHGEPYFRVPEWTQRWSVLCSRGALLERPVADHPYGPLRLVSRSRSGTLGSLMSLGFLRRWKDLDRRTRLGVVGGTRRRIGRPVLPPPCSGGPMSAGRKAMPVRSPAVSFITDCSVARIAVRCSSASSSTIWKPRRTGALVEPA